jgi:hypothetical protein
VNVLLALFIDVSPLPSVLMASDRPLNPKILSLTFEAQFICDVSNVSVLHGRELGLAVAAPLPNASVLVVTTIDPPNTVHCMQMLIIFAFVHYLSDDPVGRQHPSAILCSHRQCATVRLEFLKGQLVNHFFAAAQMLAVGSTALNRITIARLQPCGPASSQQIHPLLALISRLQLESHSKVADLRGQVQERESHRESEGEQGADRRYRHNNRHKLLKGN